MATLTQRTLAAIGMSAVGAIVASTQANAANIENTGTKIVVSVQDKDVLGKIVKQIAKQENVFRTVDQFAQEAGIANKNKIKTGQVFTIELTPIEAQQARMAQLDAMPQETEVAYHQAKKVGGSSVAALAAIEAAPVANVVEVKTTEKAARLTKADAPLLDKQAVGSVTAPIMAEMTPDKVLGHFTDAKSTVSSFLSNTWASAIEGSKSFFNTITSWTTTDAKADVTASVEAVNAPEVSIAQAPAAAPVAGSVVKLAQNTDEVLQCQADDRIKLHEENIALLQKELDEMRASCSPVTQDLVQVTPVVVEPVPVVVTPEPAEEKPTTIDVGPKGVCHAFKMAGFSQYSASSFALVHGFKNANLVPAGTYSLEGVAIQENGRKGCDVEQEKPVVKINDKPRQPETPRNDKPGNDKPKVPVPPVTCNFLTTWFGGCNPTPPGKVENCWTNPERCGGTDGGTPGNPGGGGCCNPGPQGFLDEKYRAVNPAGEMLIAGTFKSDYGYEYAKPTITIG